MAKVDATYVKEVHLKVEAAKAVAFEATMAMEATPEFKTAREADKRLELALDRLAGVQMLLNGKVV